MPDWILWVALGWLVFAYAGRPGLGPGACRRRSERARWLTAERDARRPESAGRGPAPGRFPAEAELEASLRARYVAGELSLARYEEELDRLYRRRAARTG